MEVVIGISNRHVHLCEEDIKILFGDIALENTKDLVQPNEYATSQTVTLKTAKGTLEKVRVLGSNPTRPYTQAEISRTDSFKLGIKPPVKPSGDLDGAALITIVGPHGEVEKPCCIIANRHLHINPQDRAKYGLTDTEKVCVAINAEKRTLFKDVYIKETPNGILEVHLDTDDGNGALVNTGSLCTVYKEN